VEPAPLHLRRGNLRDQALSVIRQAMVSGEIRPGRIYSASGLATSLGVSNSPVRDAMQTLVHQGVMEALPNRGFRVLPMTDADLDEVYELRLMLEVPAIRRLAGQDISAHEEQLLRHAKVCRDGAANGDMTTFLESDRDFHLGLLGLLGNRRLVTMVEMLRDQTRLYGLGQLAEQGLLVSSADEHFGILAAVRAGDGDLAVERVTQHLAHTRGTWASGAGEASDSTATTPARG
jgi:DNA-binding GntR family transcriptional regulator